NEVEGAALEAGKWTVVACSVDVPGRKVIVFLNGKQVADVDLPKDFELDVVDIANSTPPSANPFCPKERSKGPIFQAISTLRPSLLCSRRRRSPFAFADRLRTLRTRRPLGQVDLRVVPMGLELGLAKRCADRLLRHNGPVCRESLPYPR